MQNRLYIFLFCALALPFRGAGQDSAGTTQFIRSGTIEFERKENLRNEFQGESDMDDEIRKTMPENKVTYFDLSFAGNISLFQPGRDNPENGMFDAPGSTNIVYSDRSTHRQVSQKSIFGSTLLLEDSLRQLKWRITADTRTIAGFECRRATTVILDSVFVVAFYTDQIIPSAGPESFGGLPGMILGMVIPKLHTSWYATHLTLSEPKNLIPPKKGKKVNYREMQSVLQESLRDWGDNAKPNVLRIML
jgi:GLPGLI family protein